MQLKLEIRELSLGETPMRLSVWEMSFSFEKKSTHASQDFVEYFLNISGL